jgi:ABC-type transporter Mla maintaining outer membrane lipid asymmetry ATPase subunit MlaF
MIDIRELTLDAPEGRLLVAGLNLAVARGGNLLLNGPGGGGKSRLLGVLAGTVRPARGQVRIGGREVWPGAGVLALAGYVRMGFAFSSGGLLSNLSLRENIALPLRFLGVSGAELERRTDGALGRMNLQAVAGLRPHAVGATARKQANLARVLALEPELILLDDPLEGLDAADRALTQSLIHTWAADRACTLVIAAEEAAAFSHLEATRLQLSHAPMSVEFP